MEDEEEILVYVEFENCNENSAFGNVNLKLDMIGIDTDHPIMQVNGKFYEGTYEDAVGTYLFFEKDEKKTVLEDEFESESNLKYFAKTRKVLKMERIFVTPKIQDTNVININSIMNPNSTEDANELRDDEQEQTSINDEQDMS